MLTSIPLVLAFSLGALAQPPWGGPWNFNRPAAQTCLNASQVTTLLNGYTYLLEYPQGADFNATAEALLSDKFAVYSDSINTLASYPVSLLPPFLLTTTEYPI